MSVWILRIFCSPDATCSRNLAADGGDLALEISQAGFLRVLIDDRADAVIGELDLVLRQAVLGDLFRDQVPLGDLELLLFGVSGELDDFHAIAERRLNRIQHVCRRDEHHVGKIERHAEIVVAERMVLFRIQHFKQCGRRIAAEVRADLVDFIEHEHGIVAARLVDALNDAARHRAHVGAAMSADFRFVVNATKAHADELAAQRARDGFAQRRLADSRRADEAEDRAFAVLLELADRKVFDDALLDFLQAVVIRVQDPLGFLEIQIVFRRLRPRQRNHPVQIVPDGRSFRGIRMHALQAADLAFGFFGGFRRHLRLPDFPAILLDLFLQFVAFAKFLLDRFHLLAEIELPLAPIDFSARLRRDVVLDFENFKFLGDEIVDVTEPLDRIDQFENFLALSTFRSRLEATRSARRPGSLMLVTMATRSCDRFLPSATAFSTADFTFRISASSSTDSGTVSDFSFRSDLGDQIRLRFVEVLHLRP